MVHANTLDILNFWKSLLHSESLEIIQKIEHESYWIYYHTSSDQVKTAALDIKSDIDLNDEYSIYKNLVGYEGILGDWKEQSRSDFDFEEQEAERDAAIDEYLKCINSDNLNVWLDRVQNYLVTNSRDLATFPKLYSFIEAITRNYPDQVLTHFNATEKLDSAAVSVLRGLWKSIDNDCFEKQTCQWIDDNKHLYSIMKSFLFLMKYH
ncbi:hypothetical protein [Aliamphritea spongicola]|nr:hypothetical protein [Aliamphritea spongicola]